MGVTGGFDIVRAVREKSRRVHEKIREGSGEQAADLIHCTHKALESALRDVASRSDERANHHYVIDAQSYCGRYVYGAHTAKSFLPKLWQILAGNAHFDAKGAAQAIESEVQGHLQSVVATIKRIIPNATILIVHDGASTAVKARTAEIRGLRRAQAARKFHAAWNAMISLQVTPASTAKAKRRRRQDAGTLLHKLHRYVHSQVSIKWREVCTAVSGAYFTEVPRPHASTEGDSTNYEKSHSTARLAWFEHNAEVCLVGSSSTTALGAYGEADTSILSWARQIKYAHKDSVVTVLSDDSDLVLVPSPAHLDYTISSSRPPKSLRRAQRTWSVTSLFGLAAAIEDALGWKTDHDRLLSLLLIGHDYLPSGIKGVGIGRVKRQLNGHLNSLSDLETRLASLRRRSTWDGAYRDFSDKKAQIRAALDVFFSYSGDRLVPERSQNESTDPATDAANESPNDSSDPPAGSLDDLLNAQPGSSLVFDNRPPAPTRQKGERRTERRINGHGAAHLFRRKHGQSQADFEAFLDNKLSKFPFRVSQGNAKMPNLTTQPREPSRMTITKATKDRASRVAKLKLHIHAHDEQSDEEDDDLLAVGQANTVAEPSSEVDATGGSEEGQDSNNADDAEDDESKAKSGGVIGQAFAHVCEKARIKPRFRTFSADVYQRTSKIHPMYSFFGLATLTSQIACTMVEAAINKHMELMQKHPAIRPLCDGLRWTVKGQAGLRYARSMCILMTQSTTDSAKQQASAADNLQRLVEQTRTRLQPLGSEAQREAEKLIQEYAQTLDSEVLANIQFVRSGGDPIGEVDVFTVAAAQDVLRMQGKIVWLPNLTGNARDICDDDLGGLVKSMSTSFDGRHIRTLLEDRVATLFEHDRIDVKYAGAVVECILEGSAFRDTLPIGWHNRNPFQSLSVAAINAVNRAVQPLLAKRAETYRRLQTDAKERETLGNSIFGSHSNDPDRVDSSSLISFYMTSGWQKSLVVSHRISHFNVEKTMRLIQCQRKPGDTPAHRARDFLEAYFGSALKSTSTVGIKSAGLLDELDCFVHHGGSKGLLALADRSLELKPAWLTNISLHCRDLHYLLDGNIKETCGMQLFNVIFTPSKRASRVFSGSFDTDGYSFMAHGVDIKRVNKAWYDKDKNRKLVDNASHCPTLLFLKLRSPAQVKAADRVTEQLRKLKAGIKDPIKPKHHSQIVEQAPPFDIISVMAPPHEDERVLLPDRWTEWDSPDSRVIPVWGYYGDVQPSLLNEWRREGMTSAEIDGKLRNTPRWHIFETVAERLSRLRQRNQSEAYSGKGLWRIAPVEVGGKTSQGLPSELKRLDSMTAKELKDQGHTDIKRHIASSDRILTADRGRAVTLGLARYDRQRGVATPAEITTAILKSNQSNAASRTSQRRRAAIHNADEFRWLHSPERPNPAAKMLLDNCDKSRKLSLLGYSEKNRILDHAVHALATLCGIKDKNKKILFAIGDGMDSKGKGTGYVDHSGALLRHFIEYTRTRGALGEGTTIHFYLIGEEYSSQICPDPHCQHSMGGQTAGQSATSGKMARSRLWYARWLSSGRVCYRLLQCEKCGMVVHRDRAAAFTMMASVLYLEQHGEGLSSHVMEGWKTRASGTCQS